MIPNRLQFTKEEIDEINDAIEDSLKYYQDLLGDSHSDPEITKKNIKYAQ
jgi:hypothetical protein